MIFAATRPFRRLLPIVALAALAACAKAPAPSGQADPHEVANRRTHEANLRFDRAFFAPTSNAYGTILPQPVRQGVSQFSSNISLPGTMVNQLLQGEVEDAVHNAVRFLFNTTLGVAGIFDIATDIGLEERDTDFGETLHVWGFAEGDYVVLPFFGPSTERDAFGTAVDFFINPLSYVIPKPEGYLSPASEVISRFGDRYDYGDTFDALLYESADGYATARLFYLDSRRYDLGVEVEDDDLYDLYEEVYE